MIDEDPLAVSAPCEDLPTYNEKSGIDNDKPSKEQQRVCSMFDADDHAVRGSSVAKAAHTKHIVGAGEAQGITGVSTVADSIP